MDREQMEKLAAAGINAVDAMERFMGSDALYKKYMEMFVQDRTYFDLCRAVSTGDWRQAQDASHTLKGICGNLSMTVQAVQQPGDPAAGRPQRRGGRPHAPDRRRLCQSGAGGGPDEDLVR